MKTKRLEWNEKKNGYIELEENRIIKILNKIIRMSEDDTNNNIAKYCIKIKARIEG